MKRSTKKPSSSGVTARSKSSAATRRMRRRADPIQLAGQIVYASVFNTAKDVQRIQHVFVQLVRATVSDSLLASGHTGAGVTELVSTVVSEAIGAVGHAGGSPDLVVRSLAKGIVLGVHEVGGDVELAAFQTMRSLTCHSTASCGDLAPIAHDALGGVAEAADDIGAFGSDIVFEAARGAISGAGEMSTLAMDTVRDVLHGLLGHESAVPQSSSLQDPRFRFPPPR
ncbi:hypothetical protein HAV22_01395 [Massilia sp. TW-1]|uniref:Uncharacterized protein n=1 Tax=Telluria antibiotica TaxID=2717319 RepID=A0ABX0P631_9BURK|nr:hypothetical protein [Telluria antibiotica]NIA52307.1 hypothetical protein [Telluria antibiotica]